MPTVTGDRFSSQNLGDCEFCPPDGRRFRTARRCQGCARYLCLACRPWIPNEPFRCPQCGGGEVENALNAPEAAIARIVGAGHAAPFWLLIHSQRLAASGRDAEEEVVPE